MTTVAALFVQRNGCYFGLPDVDPWDEVRDARLYAGPHPAVVHPPCETWGAFARSGMTRRALGDDGGCFKSGLATVRRVGGVLEHPAESSAWAAHGLARPLDEGWWPADFEGGWTCRVEQGHYGHRARKPTWLYAVGCDLPSLPWGKSVSETTCERLGHLDRLRTPPAFRDLLISMARSARHEKVSVA